MKALLFCLAIKSPRKLKGNNGRQWAWGKFCGKYKSIVFSLPLRSPFVLADFFFFFSANSIREATS